MTPTPDSKRASCAMMIFRHLSMDKDALKAMKNPS
jgi:hypothetical protein